MAQLGTPQWPSPSLCTLRGTELCTSSGAAWLTAPHQSLSLMRPLHSDPIFLYTIHFIKRLQLQLGVGESRHVFGFEMCLVLFFKYFGFGRSQDAFCQVLVPLHFFKPMCILEKCGPSDSHSFSHNSTKKLSQKSQKIPKQQIQSLSWKPSQNLPLKPPSPHLPSLTISIQSQAFSLLSLHQLRKPGMALTLTLSSAFGLLFSMAELQIWSPPSYPQFVTYSQQLSKNVETLGISAS